ncbi:hypothetical protein GGX14DRAFT_402448 [Mycena pura]|uniref:Uncharacterized protein n=1 Tax=Mycena pura TaxID=153505 RepID=A0AAD6Y9J1_9AGAR|nr:hypothetical protein GGX14DRAFT_402448 [Mycena pura]
MEATEPGIIAPAATVSYHALTACNQELPRSDGGQPGATSGYQTTGISYPNYWVMRPKGKGSLWLLMISQLPGNSCVVLVADSLRVVTFRAPAPRERVRIARDVRKQNLFSRSISPQLVIFTELLRLALEDAPREVARSGLSTSLRSKAFKTTNIGFHPLAPTFRFITAHQRLQNNKIRLPSSCAYMTTPSSSPEPSVTLPPSSLPGSLESEQPVQRNVVLYPWNQLERLLVPLSFDGAPATPTLRAARVDDIFDLDPRQCPECFKPYSPCAFRNCGFTILMACPHTDMWLDAEDNHPCECLTALLTDIGPPPFGNLVVVKHPLRPLRDDTLGPDLPVLDIEEDDLAVVDRIIQRWVEYLFALDGGLAYFVPNP